METVIQKKSNFFLLCKGWFEKKMSVHGMIVRYVVAGGTAAVVDLGMLYVLTHYVGLHYLVSVGLAFCSAFVVSFTLQKFWTFRDHATDNIHKQSVAYLGVALGNFFLNIYLMYVCVEKLQLNYLLAQVFVGGAIACSSFLLYKYFIFARTQPNT